jgi:hypothetical protein
MATLVNQPGNNPTNKLSAAVVAAAVVEIVQAVVTIVFPDFDQPTLWTALTPVAVFLAGFFIRDDANVNVTIKGAD